MHWRPHGMGGQNVDLDFEDGGERKKRGVRRRERDQAPSSLCIRGLALRGGRGIAIGRSIFAIERGAPLHEWLTERKLSSAD